MGCEKDFRGEGDAHILIMCILMCTVQMLNYSFNNSCKSIRYIGSQAHMKFILSNSSCSFLFVTFYFHFVLGSMTLNECQVALSFFY